MLNRLHRTTALLFLVFLATSLIPLAAHAAGGAPTPPPAAPRLTPAEEAAQLYNEGLKLRDKAWKFEAQSDAATNPAEQAKLTARMEKQFEKAIKKFERATELNQSLFQAHSSLGYALRRTGRYQEALTAYNRALALNPNYTEAVEYRAEAYLGLDRVAEAKTAYMFLFNRDQKRAGELLEAMAEWVENRRQDPANVEPEALEAFASWVAERSDLATTTQQASTNGAW